MAPGTIIHTSHPTVYVIGISYDSPTAVAVTLEVSIRLQTVLAGVKNDSGVARGYKPLGDFWYKEQQCWEEKATIRKSSSDIGLASASDCAQPPTKTSHIWLIAEPSWQLSDFIYQCQNDAQNTVGAVLVGAVENVSGNYNALIFNDGYTNLYADANFVTCEPRMPGYYTLSSTLGNLKRLPANNADRYPNTTSLQDATAPVATPGTTDVYKSEHDLTKNWPKGKVTSYTRDVTKTKLPGAKDGVLTLTTSTVSYVIAPRPTPTPAMNLIWDAASMNDVTDGAPGKDLIGSAHAYGVPLYVLLGAGAYYASQTKMTTTGSPSGCIVNSSCTTTVTTNGPSLSGAALGLGLIANTFGNQQAAGITAFGAPPARILKAAAANLANRLVEKLRSACDDNKRAAATSQDDPNLTWLCSDVFTFEPQ